MKDEKRNVGVDPAHEGSERTVFTLSEAVGGSPLPLNGPLPRPVSLQEAANMLLSERFSAPRIENCTFICEEFTSVCPRTGQPDFGSVSIYYNPDAYCLESKALKFYLWAFRDEGMFCEALAAQIADDIEQAISPKFLSVTVHQARRGGIGLMVSATRGEAADELARMREERSQQEA